MKKLVLLLLLVVSCAAVADMVIAAERGRTEIQVSDAINPVRPGQIRSAVPVCQAWIDYQMEFIEVEVSENIGTVTITITDTCGRTVATETIDTATQSYTMLSMPAEGNYTITITGTDYIGTGNFTI